jgi:hypothetical protein
MKVLVRTPFGDLRFDSKVLPIVVELSEYDKKNISDMQPEATRYLAMPHNEESKYALNMDEAQNFIQTKL